MVSALGRLSCVGALYRRLRGAGAFGPGFLSLTSGVAGAP
jgi:hypothetical protein